MKSNSDVSEFCKWRFAWIPCVAQTVAAMPIDDRATALEAAERSYCQTALDAGYRQTQLEGWAAALMFQLRAEVDELVLVKQKILKTGAG
jgi:hypothetical protein